MRVPLIVLIPRFVVSGCGPELTSLVEHGALSEQLAIRLKRTSWLACCLQFYLFASPGCITLTEKTRPAFSAICRFEIVP